MPNHTNIEYHIWKTYGRPLVVKMTNGTLAGIAHLDTNREIDRALGSKIEGLEYTLPGSQRQCDYFTKLTSPNGYHGPAHRLHCVTELVVSV